MDGAELALGATSALIPQDDLLLAGLTPREILRYSAQLRDVALGRVDVVLDLLGLTTCADTRAGSPTGSRGLSGGQRKRVSIGLELLSNPSVVMADEPTSGQAALS